MENQVIFIVEIICSLWLLYSLINFIYPYIRYSNLKKYFINDAYAMLTAGVTSKKHYYFVYTFISIIYYTLLVSYVVINLSAIRLSCRAVIANAVKQDPASFPKQN